MSRLELFLYLLQLHDARSICDPLDVDEIVVADLPDDEEQDDLEEKVDVARRDGDFDDVRFEAALRNLSFMRTILNYEQPNDVVNDRHQNANGQVAELVSVNVAVVVEEEDGKDAAHGRHAVGSIKAREHVHNEHDANHDLHAWHPAHMFVAKLLNG